MTVRLVTDSTADLDPSDIDRYGITIVPLNIHFGADVYRDGVDLGKDQFYARLGESAVLPRTSQPGVSDFQAVYESLAHADAIVSVHIGGKLSGTINAAQTAAKLLTERDDATPPVIVVDSDQASMGLGFATLAAAEAIAQGASAQDAAAAAQSAARRSRVLLIVDTLEYLQKGGRIGRARAFLGTLLRTKPVLELAAGEIQGIERPRTRQKAVERLFELIVRTPKPRRIGILHGTTPAEAEALATRVRDALPNVPVTVHRCSPVIGVHTGPAALGAAIERAP
ncbi:MAG: Fatty acid-binding protein DegV [Chloroflexi bacterium]|nr:MAG: Fatty acid-binding protein DegV [Chloroflexota bacterium]